MSKNLADQLKSQFYSDHFTLKKITAYILFGAIVIVFALFGLSSNTNMGIGAVARVNNAYISLADLDFAQKQIENYYNQMFGGKMDLATQRKFFQSKAIENLVQSELLAQASNETGLYVSDKEVRDVITKDLVFLQENGVFQRDYYQRFLESQRLTPAEYETKLRKQIANRRVYKLFETALASNRIEEGLTTKANNTKVNIEYVKIDLNKASDFLKIPTQTIDENLKKEDFVKKVEERFNVLKPELDQKAEVRAQHILIAFKAGDADSEKKALDKITGLKARAQKEDFGKLAAQNSEDPGSKSKNGDLGFFTKGKMTPEFEKVAFEMAIGKVSEPVKTPYGYHLIKVTDKKDEKLAKLEDHRMKIAADLIAKDQMEEKIKSIEAVLTKGSLPDLNNELKTQNLKWQETGFFDLSAEEIPQLGGAFIADAVFEVTPDKPLLNRIVRDGDLRYVFKLKDLKSEEKKADPKSNMIANKDRFGDALDSWLEDYRKKSVIEMNQSVFSNLDGQL